MKEVWHLPFEGAPGEYVAEDQPRSHRLHLSVEAMYDGTRFFDQAEIYPVTVVKARYSGSYEGASWLCFPTGPDDLRRDFWSDWNTSDVECMMFWDRARKENWPIGYGASPTDAHNDLIMRVARQVGAAQ